MEDCRVSVFVCVFHLGTGAVSLNAAKAKESKLSATFLPVERHDWSMRGFGVIGWPRSFDLWETPFQTMKPAKG